MKIKIFILFFLVNFSLLYSDPQRYMKVYNPKYKENAAQKKFASEIDRFRKSEFNVKFSDEWLSKNFEKKGIKYILISKKLHEPIGVPLEYLIISDSSNINHIKDKDNIYPMPDYIFNNMALFIGRATKDEVMVSLSRIIKKKIYYDKLIIATYFDGKKQFTSYFERPQLSIYPDSDFLFSNDNDRIAKNAALNFFYAYWYGSLVMTLDTSTIESDKELSEKIENRVNEIIDEYYKNIKNKK